MPTEMVPAAESYTSFMSLTTPLPSILVTVMVTITTSQNWAVLLSCPGAVTVHSIVRFHCSKSYL